MVGDTDLVEYSAGRNAAGYEGPKGGRPQVKHPTFNRSAIGKYTELRNFEIEVRNIFIVKIML